MDNAVLEGILFAAGGGVPSDKLAEALETTVEEVDTALEELAGKYRFERRGMRIIRIENSWQMTSSPEFSAEIRRALELRKPPVLSKAALEVLSIIAYYQPVTRAFIEQIRGVDSSSTVGILAERGIIEECGQLNVPGRPFLFRTTGAFLRSFGISALSELPEIEPLDGVMEGQLRLESDSGGAAHGGDGDGTGGGVGADESARQSEADDGDVVVGFALRNDAGSDAEASEPAPFDAATAAAEGGGAAAPRGTEGGTL